MIFEILDERKCKVAFRKFERRLLVILIMSANNRWSILWNFTLYYFLNLVSHQVISPSKVSVLLSLLSSILPPPDCLIKLKETEWMIKKQSKLWDEGKMVHLIGLFGGKARVSGINKAPPRVANNTKLFPQNQEELIVRYVLFPFPHEKYTPNRVGPFQF